MDEDEADEVEIPTAHLHPALVVSNVFTLVANVARAISDFCDTNALLLAAHFNWERERLEMHNRAIAEIETLTQGD